MAPNQAPSSGPTSLLALHPKLLALFALALPPVLAPPAELPVVARVSAQGTDAPPLTEAEVVRIVDSALKVDPKGETFSARRNEALAKVDAFIMLSLRERPSFAAQAEKLGPLVEKSRALIALGANDQEGIRVAWNIFRMFKEFPCYDGQPKAEARFVRETLVDGLYKTILSETGKLEERDRDRIFRMLYEWTAPQFLYGGHSVEKYTRLRDRVLGLLAEHSLPPEAKSPDLHRFLDLTEKLLEAREGRVPENWYTMAGVEMLHRTAPYLLAAVRKADEGFSKSHDLEQRNTIDALVTGYERVRYAERCLENIEKLDSVGPRFSTDESRIRRLELRKVGAAFEAAIERIVRDAQVTVLPEPLRHRVDSALFRHLSVLLPPLSVKFPEFNRVLLARIETRLDEKAVTPETRGELLALLVAMTPPSDTKSLRAAFGRVRSSVMHDGDTVAVDTSTKDTFTPLRSTAGKRDGEFRTMQVPSNRLQERLGGAAMEALFREYVAAADLKPDDPFRSHFLETPKITALHDAVRAWRESLMEEFEPTLHWHKPSTSPFPAPLPVKDPQPASDFMRGTVRLGHEDRTALLLERFGYKTIDDALIPKSKQVRPEFMAAYHLSSANHEAFLGGVAVECLSIASRMPVETSDRVEHPYWRAQIRFELELAALIIEHRLHGSLGYATRHPGSAAATVLRLSELRPAPSVVPLHHRSDLFVTHRVLASRNETVLALFEGDLERRFLARFTAAGNGDKRSDEAERLIRVLNDGRLISKKEREFVRGLDPGAYTKTVTEPLRSAEPAALLAEPHRYRRLHAYLRLCVHELRRREYSGEKGRDAARDTENAALCGKALEFYAANGFVPADIEEKAALVLPHLHARLCRYPNDSLVGRASGTPLLGMVENSCTIWFLYSVERDLREKPDSADHRAAKSLAWKLSGRDPLTAEEERTLDRLRADYPAHYSRHYRAPLDRYAFELMRGLFVTADRGSIEDTRRVLEWLKTHGAAGRFGTLFRFVVNQE